MLQSKYCWMAKKASPEFNVSIRVLLWDDDFKTPPPVSIVLNISDKRFNHAQPHVDRWLSFEGWLPCLQSNNHHYLMHHHQRYTWQLPSLYQVYLLPVPQPNPCLNRCWMNHPQSRSMTSSSSSWVWLLAAKMGGEKEVNRFRIGFLFLLNLLCKVSILWNYIPGNLKNL